MKSVTNQIDLTVNYKIQIMIRYLATVSCLSANKDQLKEERCHMPRSMKGSVRQREEKKQGRRLLI